MVTVSSISTAAGDSRPFAMFTILYGSLLVNRCTCLLYHERWFRQLHLLQTLISALLLSAWVSWFVAYSWPQIQAMHSTSLLRMESQYPCIQCFCSNDLWHVHLSRIALLPRVVSFPCRPEILSLLTCLKDNNTILSSPNSTNWDLIFCHELKAGSVINEPSRVRH